MLKIIFPRVFREIVNMDLGSHCHVSRHPRYQIFAKSSLFFFGFFYIPECLSSWGNYLESYRIF